MPNAVIKAYSVHDDNLYCTPIPIADGKYSVGFTYYDKIRYFFNINYYLILTIL